MANKNSEILSAVKSAGEAALRLHEDNKSMRERLRSTQNPGLAVRQQAADAIDRLTAENAALRKDAERYLWLRDRQWPFEFQGNNAEDADVAIDAAMALTKKLARKHTPECSYWDGLMAQVCNCGVDAAMGEKP